jgi:hypothetical protein
VSDERLKALEDKVVGIEEQVARGVSATHRLHESVDQFGRSATDAKATAQEARAAATRAEDRANEAHRAATSIHQTIIAHVDTRMSELRTEIRDHLVSQDEAQGQLADKLDTAVDRINDLHVIESDRAARERAIAEMEARSRNEALDRERARQAALAQRRAKWATGLKVAAFFVALPPALVAGFQAFRAIGAWARTTFLGFFH